MLEHCSKDVDAGCSGRYYVLIGALHAPLPTLKLAERAAARLAQRGYALRTDGLTDLARAAAHGALAAGGRVQLILPSRRHETALDDDLRRHPNVSIFTAQDHTTARKTTHLHSGLIQDPLTQRLQPHLERFAQRTRALLHGVEGKDHACFALIWSQDGIERGSDAAHRNDSLALFVKQAEADGLPVFNLARHDALQRLAHFLAQQEVERSAPSPDKMQKRPIQPAPTEKNGYDLLSAGQRVTLKQTPAAHPTQTNQPGRLENVSPPENRRQVLLYADASVLNNQDADQRQAACAALLVVDDHVQDAAVKKFDLPLTNQQAEICAIIEAVRLAKAYHLNSVLLRTDSLYVVETLSGRFRVKANHQFWNALRHEAQYLELFVEHVRGHSSDRFNNLADECARLAAQGRVDQALQRLEVKSKEVQDSCSYERLR